MGYLSQASASVANPTKLILSMWVQFTENSDYQPILQAGDPYSGGPYPHPNDSLTLSNLHVVDGRGTTRGLGIHRIKSDDGFYRIVIMLAGPQNVNLIPDSYVGANDSTQHVAAVADAANGPYFGQAIAVLGDVTINDIIAAGNWFHIIFSLDFSITSKVLHDGSNNPDPAQTKKLWCRLNGLDVGLGNLGDVYFGADALPTSGYISDRLEATLGGPGYTTKFTSYVDDSTVPGGAPTTSEYVIPPWPIALNGFEFALPCVASLAASNNGIRYGDVMIWCGQYADPTPDNLAKFITVGGGPVNPSVAIAAFGTPTFHFKGPASGFNTNNGGGGSLIKTGTISAFTPGP